MPQKYHHLVPRTYLSPWVYNKDSLSVRFRGRKKRDVKNCDAKSKIEQNSAILKKID